MNRYKYLLVHGICAALMTLAELRFGIISRATMGSGILSSPDLTWETIHHFMANAFFVFFLVIPLGFVLQYAYFRLLCRESLENVYGDRDASLSSLYVSAAILAVLLFSFLPAAHAGGKKMPPALTFYGVEISRQPAMGAEEFEEFVKNNPQADSLLWKYPGIQYKGTGDVVLAGHFLDLKEAESRQATLGGKAKILGITVDPFFAGGAIYLYRFPTAGDDDMVVGEIWVRANGRARLLQKDALLGHYAPENTAVFRAIGLSKGGEELLYCSGDDCYRYDLKTDRRVADPSLKPRLP